MITTIIVVLLALLALGLSLTLIIGLSLGLGWLLTLLLKFSLFEGTLIGLFALAITGYIWGKILHIPFSLPFDAPESEDYEEHEAPEIPTTRFWKKDKDRTWEKWLQYTLANAIYDNLLDFSGITESMSERDLMDMSVRLAEAATTGLKQKSTRAKQLRMNRGMLVHELAQLGSPPCEENILAVAVDAINAELSYLNEILLDVGRGNHWHEQSDLV